MEKTAERRLHYVDVAKGIGIYLIVLGHAFVGFVSQVIYVFHVPAFFFLSGFVYRKKTARVFWREKLMRLYVPYLIFALLSILLFSVLGEFMASRLGLELESNSLWESLAGMLYGNPRTGLMRWNRPLWFVLCLISVYLLAGFTEIAAARFGKAARFLAMALGFGGGWLFSEPLHGIALPFCLEHALLGLVYFELGVLCRNLGLGDKLGEFAKRKLPGLLTAVALLAAVCGISYYIGVAQMISMEFGRSYLLCFFASLCGILFLLLISLYLQGSRLLQRLGQCSLAILMMHKFPLLLFQTVIPVTKTLLEQGNTLGGVACALTVAVVVTGVCLLAAVALEKVFPLAVGKWKPEKQPAGTHGSR